MMMFNQFAYGQIKMEHNLELRTGETPETSLIFKDMKGITFRGDDDTCVFITNNSTDTELFIVMENGFTAQGKFEQITEEGYLRINGYCITPNSIRFIGVIQH